MHEQNDKIGYQFAGLRFSEVKGTIIYDSENTKLGKLQDAIFKRTDRGVMISKFSVGGSFFEELMEDLKLKKDIDPIFGVEHINSVSPLSIKLNAPKNELKSTVIHDDAISDEEIKLSKLGKIKVHDSEGTMIGNIVDLKFEKGGFQFVIGDGAFKELLEDLNLREDIDFLLSPDAISKFDSESVHLTMPKHKMDLLFKESTSNPAFKKEHNNQKLQAGLMSTYYPR